MTETAAPAKPKTEGDRIESMLDALSPGDKILVYRVVINEQTGKETRPVKAVLTEFQGVEDLDSWIYSMAAEQHWPPGEYILDHRKPGVHGVHCRKQLSLDPPPAPPSTTGAQPSALELVKQAKDILGMQQQASPDKVLESVTAAMRVGADAAAAKAAPSDGTATLLKPLIEGLVARLGKEPPAPAAAPDPFLFLERLKQMGLIGQQPGTDKPKTLAEQIGELESLVDVLSGLRGPAGPAVEPTAVAVAKILGPYLPQVLATINNIVDVTRLRFSMAGSLLPPSGAPSNATRVVGPAPIPPAVQVLVAQTQAAIGADDDGFFPAFADGVTAHIVDGRNFLLAIQKGTIEEEQALTAVHGTGLLNATEPRTRAWLIRFVHWLRAAQPMAAAASPSAPVPPSPPDANAVRARCERCQQEYDFASRVEFEQDTRICDNETASVGELCKGNLVLLAAGSAP
jgi:hypothetical protein